MHLLTQLRSRVPSGHSASSWSFITVAGSSEVIYGGVDSWEEDLVNWFDPQLQAAANAWASRPHTSYCSVRASSANIICICDDPIDLPIGMLALCTSNHHQPKSLSIRPTPRIIKQITNHNNHTSNQQQLMGHTWLTTCQLCKISEGKNKPAIFFPIQIGCLKLRSFPMFWNRPWHYHPASCETCRRVKDCHFFVAPPSRLQVVFQGMNHIVEGIISSERNNYSSINPIFACSTIASHESPSKWQYTMALHPLPKSQPRPRTVGSKNPYGSRYLEDMIFPATLKGVKLVPSELLQTFRAPCNLPRSSKIFSTFLPNTFWVF